MHILFKLASFVFHPVWMPFAGSLIFFLISPRFFPLSVVKAKLLAIAIMSIFIPIVFYFMLKTLGQNSSYFLEDVKERKWPLFFNLFLIIIILSYVLNDFDYPALYYYFVAILISSAIALVLVLFRIKISLHMMGMAGLTAFLIILSLYYNINLIYTISFFIAITGLTASARLHFRAHTGKELMLGFFTGLFPQVLVLYFWL